MPAQVFEEALNAVKFLGWHKKFGLAQNILGPVKGQGIRCGNFAKGHLNLNLLHVLTHSRDSKEPKTKILSEIL